MFIFLEKLIIFILPNIKKIKINCKNKNIINFQIQNIFDFFELKTEFFKFKNIPSIDVAIHTNSKTKKDLFILLNSLFVI